MIGVPELPLAVRAVLGAVLHETIGPGTMPAQPLAGAQVLASSPSPSGAFVVRIGAIVVKIHPADTEPGQFRIRLADAVALPAVFLPPRHDTPLRIDGRIATVWPYGRPVDPHRPDLAPWNDAARLLAGLHGASCPDTRPPRTRPVQEMPQSVVRSLHRLGATPDASLAAADVPRWGRDAVLSAARGLPPWTLDERAVPIRGRPVTLTHGDWHLGQMVRTAAGGPGTHEQWRLIDVDSLGLGDPVWDLARPAMWLLAGVIDLPVWHAFLAAYLEAGGPALPAGDPWPVLDPVARAAAVQGAASALARAGRTGERLDDVGGAFLDACRRITAL